jgi:hypothetical protein
MAASWGGGSGDATYTNPGNYGTNSQGWNGSSLGLASGLNKDQWYDPNTGVPGSWITQSPGDAPSWGGGTGAAAPAQTLTQQSMATPVEAPVGGAAFGGYAGGASGSLGLGATPYQQNPYLTQYGDALTKQAGQQFSQITNPAIQQSALANGQYGGSRQGIAQGVAAGNAQTGLGQALAQLYASGYNTDTNNALQQQSLNNNFYTNNRSLDLTQYGLGANLVNQGVTGQNTMGNQAYTAGNTFLNAPTQSMQQLQSIINQYLSNGQSTTSGTVGGGATGAIGGGLTTLALLQKLGLV